MKFKAFIVLLITAALFLLPGYVSAQITWSSELYTAYAETDGGIQNKQGPPLPQTASSSYYFSDSCGGSALSTVGNSQFSIETTYKSSLWCTPFVKASAEFDGTYLSSAPYFSFQYDFLEAGANFNVNVFNNTTYSTIYDKTFYSANADTLLLPTPVGDEIRVRFKISALNDNASGSLDYGMAAIVPEPVSTTLMITGGILMAGRLYFRKKAV